MDPDETLRLLREYAATVDDYAIGDLDGVAYAQAELFRALDAWLTSGGFRPRAWTDSPEDH